MYIGRREVAVDNAVRREAFDGRDQLRADSGSNRSRRDVIKVNRGYIFENRGRWLNGTFIWW